ncbi:urokinase plasminogen activator surface receptor-like [Hyperolius riggenbachi]|uniref:urokinase plasminogen activator surface receptor-like n=1 Tax=Hyperolius riggenbachi TaxID=752182 RepID=UPI0035A2E8E6
MNTGCCTTDNCTPVEPAVAAISTVTNGLSCPACFSLTSTVCLSDVRTQCTGTENVCASYSMRNASVTSGPYLLMEGCATENVCVTNSGIVSTITNGPFSMNITCLNASITIPTTRLTCISCSANSQALCSGPSITCPSTADVCISTYTQTQILQFGLANWTLTRGCGQLSQCNQPQYLTNDHMTVRINTGCCTTDNCTPPQPTEAVVSTVINGLVCPSCFSLTSTVCLADATTHCTGTENQCVTYSTSSVTDPSKPYLLAEGCATQGICSNFVGIISSTIVGTTVTNISCSNAAIGPIISTITPVITTITTPPTTQTFSLSCISCTSSSQAPCTGPSITCPSTSDVCTSVYTETQIIDLGTTAWTLVRGCGQPSVCNQPRYLSNQQLTVNMNTSCCTTNNCFPGEPLGKYLYPDLRPNNAKDLSTPIIYSLIIPNRNTTFSILIKSVIWTGMHTILI